MTYDLVRSRKDPQGIALTDSASVDAFFRLRVSNPLSIFDQTLEFGIGQLFWDSALVGAASTVTHLPNESSVLLTCDTGSSDSVIRQTFRYHHYQPGKSQRIVTTGIFGAAAANVRRRMGYFDAQNGIFLEQNGTVDVAIVKRTFISGSAVDNRVAQANWNLDTLDGSGPSGLRLDLSKDQLFCVDLQWLGAGRVRVGFIMEGQLIYCHQFLHANVLSTVYMTTASLPVRYEIANTASQGSTHTMTQGCCSVQSEGGIEEEASLFFSANNGTTSIGVTTRRAILSFRPKATVGPSSKVNRILLLPETFSALVSTNNALLEIVYDPTFTTPGGLTWTSVDTQSAAEFCVHGDGAAGAITLGKVVDSVYVAPGAGQVSTAVVQNPVKMKFPLTLDMNGANPKAISLVATSLNQTATILGAWSWREVR